MNNKYRISAILFALFLCLAASAQNLDPTVVVSRDYEGKLMEVHKPKLDMAVPDSVLRFDLDFDYSVSDSPYKGAYDFTPYLLDMRPSPVARETGTLYLNVGAGYQLHPELDIVWSPDLKSRAFRMNVFARNRSFVGQYWNIAPTESENTLVFGRSDDDAVWKGIDLSSSAGFDGRFDWKKGTLSFTAAYDGLVQTEKRTPGVSRSFNAFDASVALKSKDKKDAAVGYLIDLDYRYGNDAMDLPQKSSLRENLFAADAVFFASLGKNHRLCFDLKYDLAGYDGFFSTSASCASLAPRYQILLKNWDFDLGVKIAKVFRTEEVSGMYRNKIQSIYPDVKVGFKGIRSMYVYLTAGGGPTLETYSSLLQTDRHINMFYGNPMLDVSDQRFYAAVGLDGHISTRFSYALKGGYVNSFNSPLASFCHDPQTGNYMPGISYVSYSRLFAALECRLLTERFDMDATVEYADYMTDDKVGALLPAALTGDISLRYNWIKRVYAGVVCNMSSARNGYIRNVVGEDVSYTPVRLPGYADLGVNLEYLVNRRFSIWAKGGNLLGMTIQRSLFYAEKGPYFTLGFTLDI